MKTNPISFVGAILLILFCNYTQAQSFGTTASAVWISDCNQSNFFNTSGNVADLIGPTGNVFDNNNFGVHTQNSGTLILRGAQVKTFKNPASSNVCSVRMFYRVYLQSGVPGAFNSIDLPFLEDCNTGSGTFPTGGPCVAGDQKWHRVIPDGTTSPYAPVNLTSYAPGNYVLEVYYDVSGSNTSTTLCNDLVTMNNGGSNYKAYCSIQSPNLSCTNPSSCFGNQGSITIGGLVPGASYQLSYTDDGVAVGPSTYVPNASGQIIISGLNKGFYSNFVLQINGCTTNLYTGIILSDPIFVPTFNAIPPFCAGTTAPILPTTSNNGMTGTWNPSTVDNQNTGNYTFTPSVNQCGVPITITITVIPRTTPTFSFGTSLTICGGGTVPTLPNTSTNGINGTWNPSVVDNQNSGTYTFTPNAGQCATGTTFTVTVNPNITPTFSFGANLTICAGATVPALPTTSTNGITGTWSPSAIDNQNSATYTFTPTAGQCATTTTFSVTVNPNVTPAFSFGNSLTICGSGTVPALPTTSTNGITGTWNPSTVDNQNSATYTFTPTAGQCATTTTFSVTVNPNITPTFSFGTSLSICAGAAVPTLPTTSRNGITGTWSPSVVDNQNSGTYTFTPTAGQCATIASFAVTVNPNIVPTFSFGTNLTICASATVPTLPTTSTNGITGTWSPSAVDNQNSGSYTFTPNVGQCATTASFAVTVNPNVVPTFSFGPNLTICAGATVPTLPTTSTNGITGTWNPSAVSNQNSATYTFTPTAGQCATTASFVVTVDPNIAPTFSFGANLTICAGAAVPALPTTSTNGITGTWNPSSVDDQNSGNYTFTPTAGQCATSASFAVTVNPNITPAFSFGTTLTICAGGTVPTLPTTSSNGITGTWSPSVVDNQNSATYTFTPAANQCVTGSVTFSVTVTPNAVPVFSIGNNLTICAGDAVPTLPSSSDNGIAGSWNPSVVNNQSSGTYIFTAAAGQCVTPFIFTVTVNPILTPAFSFGNFQSICMGSTVPTLSGTSTNGVIGTWNPSVVDNTTNSSYTFTPSAGQCANNTTFTLEVNAVPSTTIRADTTVYDGDVLPLLNFVQTTGAVVNWTNSNPSIGLPASGTESVPSFTAINRSNVPVTATVTATPVIGGCSGIAQKYTIKVLPLNKDVFVPNVFTPNGDGKNDILFVYGNYIDKVEMRIFNQWGQQIAMINNKTQGWDGKHKGDPQPVGVYVYVLRAVLSDGRTINLKGSITLLR
ncbi:MAG: gliding motility-associated C-terminal domain-containing protein [Bacteroidetes bacterium]|nr:MAG: gliding motility-associated C-terminal domain-containing protein [Bacteroidota bacterium]